MNDVDRLFDQLADIMASRKDSWRHEAACREEAVALFFPERGETDKTKAAASICEACPVAIECRSYALSLPARDRSGIWGGKSVDRRRLSAQERLLVDQASGFTKTRAPNQ